MQVTLADSGHEKKILSFVESVMSSLSMRRYTEECERQFADIFNCERVNMILVDRFKKQLFRFKSDWRDPDRVVTESHTMDHGLAGHVAISCHTLFSDRVAEENRYYVEVDDPKSEKDDAKPARQIISCPVFARTDREDLSGAEQGGGNALGSFPRAIIQLINKKTSDGF